MFQKFILLIAFVSLFMLSGCSIFSAPMTPQVEAECERLDVSRECNVKLYAKQVSAMGMALIELYDAGDVKQSSYDIYSGVLNTARGNINAYAEGGDKLEDVANDLNSVAKFVTARGGAFEKIIDIFK